MSREGWVEGREASPCLAYLLADDMGFDVLAQLQRLFEPRLRGRRFLGSILAVRFVRRGWRLGGAHDTQKILVGIPIARTQTDRPPPPALGF